MSDLDDLLATAQIESNNGQRSRKTIATKHDLNYRQCFTRPENWRHTAQVHAFHVGSNIRTLLGLYDELVHKTVPRCRRLVLTSHRMPELPLKLEEFTGPEWFSQEDWLRKRAQVERKVEGIWDIVLDMGQHLQASTVECVAVLAGGGFQALLLGRDTCFSGDTPRTMLSLPKDLDILECLTQECRMNLWKELGS